MGGLNYGNSYTKIKETQQAKEVGVSYAKLAGKWVVRVPKKGNISTLASFKTKEEADIYYASIQILNK
jgi:hypothetical protein